MAKKTKEKNTSEQKKIITDGELLIKMMESMETDYYTFGAYTNYDGLDIKNLKNPFCCNENKN